MTTPTIIGLTGSFGSGCSHIAQQYLVPKGFEYISLSQTLKELFREEFKREPTNRRELQMYGNHIRNDIGKSHLAEIAAKRITDTPDHCWVVDSIKNPFEVDYFRDYYPNFYLWGVFAEYNIRWERVKLKYDENQRNFREDDEIDGSDDVEYGQRVRDCFSISDIIITNNIDHIKGSETQLQYEEFIDSFIKLVTKQSQRGPWPEEALMAMAYANSQRSSCSKRRVGAIIVDNNGFVFSSGYNEVPIGERPCHNLYTKCYRDMIRESISNDIDQLIPDFDLKKNVKKTVLKQVKMLERCRSLHAEEQAILNVARLGTSNALKGATLYTTTYPCNLCANKIAQVGINKVVYLEPYPMKEAKVLLQSRSIEQKPFEGVNFKGYFKLFGGEFL